MIPEKLKYVRKKAVEIAQYDSHRVGESKKRMVRETFVVDASNPKTLATAIGWAKGYQQGDDHYDIVEVPNTPIEAIEIVGLSRRGRGGRAWKVLIDGAYYVDLREDVLLEALINGTGVEEAHLKGPFIWASSGQGLKLTRRKSSDHKEAERRQVRHKTKVKKADLEIGGVYENVTGSRYTFLGYVDWDTIRDSGHWTHQSRNTWPYSSPSGPWIPKLQLTTERRYQLWYRCDWALFGTDKIHSRGLTYLDTIKNRQMSVKVGQVNLPADILDVIRGHQIDLLKGQIADINAIPLTGTVAHGVRSIDQNERDRQVRQLQIYAWRNSTYRRPGQPRPDVPELKELAEMSGVKENL